MNLISECPSFKARPYSPGKCDHKFDRQCFRADSPAGDGGECPWHVEPRADSDDDGEIEAWVGG